MLEFSRLEAAREIVEVAPNAGCSTQGQRIPVSLPALPKWGKIDGV